MTMPETAGEPALAVAVVTGIDEYQQRLLRGMNPVLRARGIPLVVHANDPYIGGVPASLVRLIRQGRPSGVITSASSAVAEEQTLMELLRELRIPAVHLGRTLPDRTCVRGDNETGMRALMAHLLDERGVRRPVLVRGVVHQQDSIVREEIIREELARRGLQVDSGLVVRGEFGHDVAYRAMRALLRSRRDMDAVIAFNDPSALGALGALADEGLRVPEDVVVTGFDNDQAASLSWPGLTTVDQDLEGQGRAAATALVHEIDGGASRGEITVPSRLIVRGSTVSPGPTGSSFDTAVAMARATQAQLSVQDAILGMNRALIRCRTLDQVVDALASRLDRLGIGRCFLAVYQADDGSAGTFDQARLVLDYRDGEVRERTPDLFPTHRLLPEASRHVISDSGLMVLQPLSVLDRDLGYVLFEGIEGPASVTEVLRMDLSRTLDGVASTLELTDHAATLERLVAQRTEELESA
ncbi:MAG: LacI family transcriptional regulator, partial [Actinomycetales bacterium]|nr:LacI family transcriptional regulator [Actinomycetales bacterium]